MAPHAGPLLTTKSRPRGAFSEQPTIPTIVSITIVMLYNTKKNNKKNNETYRACRKYTWQWMWRLNGPATPAVHVVINIYKWYNAMELWKLKLSCQQWHKNWYETILYNVSIGSFQFQKAQAFSMSRIQQWSSLIWLSFRYVYFDPKIISKMVPWGLHWHWVELWSCRRHLLVHSLASITAWYLQSDVMYYHYHTQVFILNAIKCIILFVSYQQSKY